VTTATRTRAPKADSACVDAVDLAREALVAVTGEGQVGEHLGHQADGDRVVTHLFGCLIPGYESWRWAVTVARASRAKSVTVCESCLLPGPGAVLAPPWVPWSDRVEPGDLGPGDLLPTEADDPRLVPAYTGADEDPDPDAVRGVVDELGLGRPRVLSPEGREDTAERWYEGEGGPDTETARAAPARCTTCGFLVGIRGPLGRAFGVCANAMSPFDGQVVSLDHGCGAHSEVAVARASPSATADPVHDTVSDDLVAHGSVSPGEPAEELGHS
jgi:hypothetical protein